MFMNLVEKFKIYLRFYHDYFIFGINFKFFNQKVESFSIFEKMRNFVYRLEFLDIMRIHSIIFIIQLKSISNRFENPYSRTFTQSIFFIEKIQNIHLESDFTFQYKFYKIKKLLKRRDIKKNIKYLIK